MREMLVGRFWWCCGRGPLDEMPGGVRSTSWIWPGDRPGKANNDLVGLGDSAHKPGLSYRPLKVGGIPRSLSVVSKVCSLCGGLLNRYTWTRPTRTTTILYHKLPFSKSCSQWGRLQIPS
jgi:hypothetical protein